MGGICRFAEQSAVFENYWADCFPQDWAVPTSLCFVIIPTDCSASLSQFSNHSESADLLRKFLLPHVWAGPKFKSLLLQAGTALEFGPLASSF